MFWFGCGIVADERRCSQSQTLRHCLLFQPDLKAIAPLKAAIKVVHRSEKAAATIN
jgi:hypothetical protein